MSLNTLFQPGNDYHLYCDTMTCNSLGANCINSCANEGSGTGIFDSITGVSGSRVANFKSLVAGGGISITPTSNQITISDTGSGAPVQSVFSRTGNVTAQTGDYSISQITNSSVLANSSNVNIVSPSQYQILQYNGSGVLQNVNIVGFSNFVVAINQTVTGVNNTLYCATNSTVIIPPSMIGSGDGGSFIGVYAAQLEYTIISIPSGTYLNGVDGPFTLTCNDGYFEIVSISYNAWSTRSISGFWTSSLSSSTKPYINTQLGLNNLTDTSITSPTNNQILQYNSTASAWENATVALPSSGSYTPTYTLNTNITAISLLQGVYSQIGNIVNVSVVANITVNSAADANMIIIISIPVNTNSGFSSIYSAPGTTNIYYTGGGLTQLGGTISASISGNTVSLISRYTLATSQSIVLMANFSYSILG